MGLDVHNPVYRSPLHPCSDKRDGLPRKKEPVIAAAKSFESGNFHLSLYLVLHYKIAKYLMKEIKLLGSDSSNIIEGLVSEIDRVKDHIGT
jgi:hypothetical protein